MNGVDCIRAIRSDFPDARIVVLTTYSGDVQVVRALKIARAQAVLAAAPAMIGPGAWSIDARRFGKKHIELSDSYTSPKVVSSDCTIPVTRRRDYLAIEISVIRVFLPGRIGSTLDYDKAVESQIIRGGYDVEF